MATLQIKKKSLRTWEHIDSQLGTFILSKFEFSEDGQTFQIVENNGAKRRIYNVPDIEVFDIGGSAETFANITLLALRLEELKYPAFNLGGVFEFDPSNYDLSEFNNESLDPYVHQSELTGGDLQSVTEEGNTTTVEIIGNGGLSGSGSNWLYEIGKTLIDSVKYFRFFSKGDDVTIPDEKEANMRLDADEGFQVSALDGSDNSVVNVKPTYVEQYACDFPDIYLTRTTGLGFRIQNAANAFWATLKSSLTADRDYQLPNASGTLALTSDIRFKVLESTGGYQTTGAAANTIVHSALIPANTITKVSRIIVKNVVRRTNANGNATFRIYLNSSPSITGAVVIALYTNTTTQIYNPFDREFVVNTTVLEGLNFALSSLNDRLVGGAFSSTAFDETVNQYIIFAIQPLSAADIFDTELNELSIVS